MTSPAASSNSTDTNDARRKSSDTKFANLQDLKRNPESAASQQRRESLTEQSQPKGVLGNLWESAVKPAPEKK
ncbi:hypothetical protein MBLNU230_g6098t1 [Neophaeotheca triangularis]